MVNWIDTIDTLAVSKVSTLNFGVEKVSDRNLTKFSENESIFKKFIKLHKSTFLSIYTILSSKN